MRKFLALLAVAACLTEEQAWERACTLLCRHAGIGVRGAWNLKRQNCDCTVEPDFEAVRGKRIVFSSKRPAKPSEYSAPAPNPIFPSRVFEGMSEE